LRDLRVHRTILHGWLKAASEGSEPAFPGHGRTRPEQAELVGLRREVTKLKAERDILEKAVADVKFGFIARQRDLAGGKAAGRDILSRLGAKRWNSTDVLDAIGVPSIVSGLHTGPHATAVAEQLAETNRNGRRHRLALSQDIVEVLAGNPEQAGDLGLAPAGRRNHVFAQKGTRMRRAPSGVALGGAGHVRPPQ
jgi:hypothetical protein